MLTEKRAQIRTSNHALSVSELNRQARLLLERSFLTIEVTGEISNFVKPSSGHWYFTLKDDKAQVRCAMFKNRNQLIRFSPKQGDQVVVRAKVSLYEGRGDYQLICEFMSQDGGGSLQAAYEELKLKLNQEGLFGNEHKKPLPEHPARIGVVTSPTGAAIHDILTVLKRRFPGLPVTLYPTAVQGEDAPAQICKAIILAEAHQECDVLIVGRGGGSLEDLWPFNTEPVARTIFDCEIPVISAVGHEVDTVISDYVADVRAPTPSAAAELISPDQHQLKLRLRQQSERLQRQLNSVIQDANNRIYNLKSRLRHPGQQLREKAQRLDHLEIRLQQAAQLSLSGRKCRIENLRTRLQANTPQQRLLQHSERIKNFKSRLAQGILHKLEFNRQQLNKAAAQLNTVSPLATLERGYAIVQDQQGKVLTDTHDSSVGDQIEARLHQGRMKCTINEIITD
ncbi:exodeoxyribonuclease VII large subunit [Neptuniibacter caesariensis]|uniref:Exodeoxyribonuclease 7 large subunit n=1 Tax=Neptuniibacter caesariensis TaxID=207954 RepID=A0A7U8C6J4_NEPCE|nr:exodeoxyribonuclease VII large subunit [Neptuniibacter caesariensis]EAR60829.1 exodeoxyribonuclease VII large subunit [Oceanospirillum sp. MED92] [Neptuniibacter caesariensis]